jgi:hypothetical protein
MTFNSVDLLFDALSTSKNKNLQIQNKKLNAYQAAYMLPDEESNEMFLLTDKSEYNISSNSSATIVSSTTARETANIELIKSFQELLVLYLPGSETYEKLHQELYTFEHQQAQNPFINPQLRESAAHLQEIKNLSSNASSNASSSALPAFSSMNVQPDESSSSFLNSRTHRPVDYVTLTLHYHLFYRIMRALSMNLFNAFVQLPVSTLEKLIHFFKRQLYWITRQHDSKALFLCLKVFLFLRCFHKDSPMKNELITLFFQIFPFVSSPADLQIPVTNSTISSENDYEVKPFLPIPFEQISHTTFQNFIRIFKQILMIPSFKASFMRMKEPSSYNRGGIRNNTVNDLGSDHVSNLSNNAFQKESLEDIKFLNQNFEDLDDAAEVETDASTGDLGNTLSILGDKNASRINYQHEAFKTAFMKKIMDLYQREFPHFGELVAILNLLTLVVDDWEEVPEQLQDVMNQGILKHFLHEKSLKDIINVMLLLMYLKHPSVTDAQHGQFHKLFLLKFKTNYDIMKSQDFSFNFMNIFRLLQYYRLLQGHLSRMENNDPNEITVSQLIPPTIQHALIESFETFVKGGQDHCKRCLKNDFANTMKAAEVYRICKEANNNVYRASILFNSFASSFPNALSEKLKEFVSLYADKNSVNARLFLGNINNKNNEERSTQSDSFSRFLAFLKFSTNGGPAKTLLAMNRLESQTSYLLMYLMQLIFLLLRVEHKNPFIYFRANSKDIFSLVQNFYLPYQFLAKDEQHVLSQVLYQQYYYQQIYVDSVFSFYDYLLSSNKKLQEVMNSVKNVTETVETDTDQNGKEIQLITWKQLSQESREVSLVMISELLENNAVYKTFRLFEGTKVATGPVVPAPETFPFLGPLMQFMVYFQQLQFPLNEKTDFQIKRKLIKDVNDSKETENGGNHDKDEAKRLSERTGSNVYLSNSDKREFYAHFEVVEKMMNYLDKGFQACSPAWQQSNGNLINNWKQAICDLLQLEGKSTSNQKLKLDLLQERKYKQLKIQYERIIGHLSPK